VQALHIASQVSLGPRPSHPLLHKMKNFFFISGTGERAWDRG